MAVAINTKSFETSMPCTLHKPWRVGTKPYSHQLAYVDSLLTRVFKENGVCIVKEDLTVSKNYTQLNGKQKEIIEINLCRVMNSDQAKQNADNLKFSAIVIGIWFIAFSLAGFYAFEPSGPRIVLGLGLGALLGARACHRDSIQHNTDTLRAARSTLRMISRSNDTI